MLATFAAVVLLKFYLDVQITTDKNRKREVVVAMLRDMAGLVNKEEASGNIEQIRDKLSKYAANSNLKGVLICKPQFKSDPLVVYEGELTEPFVEVLFLGGYITQWTRVQWLDDRRRLQALDSKKQEAKKLPTE